MWTAGLHGGARFPMGGDSVVTPYFNFDYVDAKLKSFSETGGNGAELTVDNNHSRHSFLTGGVKWATPMGRVILWLLSTVSSAPFPPVSEKLFSLAAAA